MEDRQWRILVTCGQLGMTTWDGPIRSVTKSSAKPEGQPASVKIREPEPVNILTALGENERLVRKITTGSERQSRWHGSSILWGTYTSPYTQRNYSRLTIPKAIGAGMKSA